jgi:hypothetical protein
MAAMAKAVHAESLETGSMIAMSPICCSSYDEWFWSGAK